MNDPNVESFDSVSFPKSLFSAGRSVPNRSARSVCSQRFIRTILYPIAAVRFSTNDVLPTPGRNGILINLKYIEEANGNYLVVLPVEWLYSDSMQKVDGTNSVESLVP